MRPTAKVRFPKAFLTQMRELLIDEADFDAFLTVSQQPLRPSLRVNTLKISVADFMRLITSYRWQLTPVPWCAEGFWISRDDSSLPLGSTAEHLSGLFYIQEASSMLPVSTLFDAVKSPERILDLAAAPGSKTTQIAALMQNKGVIVANEYAASRVKILHANISRCGITNTVITHSDGRILGTALHEQFDAVLLDAPCSGEGATRKDPAALQNWSPESNLAIAATQQALIASAFHALKPGGVLVYSTCTLNRAENQHVVDWLLKQWPDAVERLPLNKLFPGAEHVATAEGDLHVFPQRFNSEGFFVARLHKKKSTPFPSARTHQPAKLPFRQLASDEASKIVKSAADAGLRWNSEQLSLWQRDNEIWLFPSALTALFGRMRFSRSGLRLAECFSAHYRWQHEAVIALCDTNAPNLLELNAAQAEEWYRGRDIYPDQTIARDEVIVTFQHQPLGLAKKIGNRLKNSYPRTLVRDGRLFNTALNDCSPPSHALVKKSE